MAGIKTEDFFKRKRETSEIKSEILTNYFKFWCSVLLYGQKYKQISQVVYIDLFSGPGYYEDGTSSTPIKILDCIYASKGQNVDLNKGVKTFFNDVKPQLVEKLGENILKLPYYDELIFKPVLLNEEANHELLKNLLNKDIPSLTFIDPFGYKFSLDMLLSAVKDWGSDLFMLFNINRIRAAIQNPVVENVMNEIFQNKLEAIRKFYISEKNPQKRESYLINQFEKTFNDKGYMSFKFKINFSEKNAPSHYLILVTKVKMAYHRIKEIMSKYSDLQSDGVPLFSANSKMPPIFFEDSVDFSIYKLEIDLLNGKNKFNNSTLESIFEIHSIGTNYIKQNYKTAIENLLNKKKINLFDKNRKQTSRITYTAIVNFI